MLFDRDWYDDVPSLSSSSSASHSAKKEDDVTVMRVIGIVLYGSLFIATLADYIYKRMKARRKLPTMVTTFYVGLPLFMLSE